MDAAKNVTATFHLIAATYVLTVDLSGGGTGTVTSSPAGINCGATCSASFTAGTVVTLTATPTPDSKHRGWRGACSGIGAVPCQVTLGAPKSVTAIFRGPESLPLSSGFGGMVPAAPARREPDR